MGITKFMDVGLFIKLYLATFIFGLSLIGVLFYRYTPLQGKIKNQWIEFAFKCSLFLLPSFVFTNSLH